MLRKHSRDSPAFALPFPGSMSHSRVDLLSAALMVELARFTGEGWEQEDDITLLTLERSTTRS
jgi:hypothetical protein